MLPIWWNKDEWIPVLNVAGNACVPNVSHVDRQRAADPIITAPRTAEPFGLLSIRHAARPPLPLFHRSTLPRSTARPAIPSTDCVHRLRARSRSANRTIACHGPTQLIRSHYRSRPKPAYRSLRLIAQTRRGREIGQWHATEKRKGRRV